ncbi:MAG: NAD-dependent DNA ligase LigA [Lachnospiraceae bacterium]|nr:NAD-dependent DNA ligase LigA [Lachnospiraceae bacterium]
MDNEKIKRIDELTALLSEASRAYYAEDREIMSNFEYDKLYDELAALEKETGIVRAGSPTISVGYEAVDSLPKERHASPMLSLGKTKSREELAEWLGDKEGLLSWKEDGLTVVLTYQNGELLKCVTRGNGETGEVVTANAKTFVNLPVKIPYDGELVIRGEAVITYSDFERINAEIDDADAKYKNPRNLASGSVRQLDSAVTAARSVRVIAFALVSAVDKDGKAHDLAHSMSAEFEFLKQQGFTVVEYEKVNAGNVVEKIGDFEKKIISNDIPSDGLVLAYDDKAYAESLGRTAKFPRGAIAFKWSDETADTVLREVEWNTSRTGLINPVAIFDSVELEGTSVSRASIHNISIIKELKLGIGDRISVYKANMIIPQIAENHDKSDDLIIPDKCPVCGAEAVIEKAADSEVLKCTNEECPARKLKSFVHFVERDAMNIEGLSEMTLDKLIQAGLIKEFADIYRLRESREEVLKLEGFKEKSCDNLLDAIDKSRETTLPRVLYALGIPGVGAANAKMVAAHFDDDISAIRAASEDELSAIDKVGPVMASDIYRCMHDENFLAVMEKLLDRLSISKRVNSGDSSLAGLVFVVTGSLNKYASRAELKEAIEAKGGKVTGKVTGKTKCLINNDVNSSSSKNKEAKALGVEIISEEDFIKQYLE